MKPRDKFLLGIFPQAKFGVPFCQIPDYKKMLDRSPTKLGIAIYLAYGRLVGMGFTPMVRAHLWNYSA